MKDCGRYAPMLSARPGEISGEEQATLSDHLAACPACRNRLADERALDGLVGEALMRRAAQRDFGSFADGVMARVERRRGGALRGFVRRHRWLAAGSALAPALAALALIVYVRVAAGPQPGQIEVVSEEHAPMVIDTSDGPLILLGAEVESEGT